MAYNIYNSGIKKSITFEQAITMGIHVSIFRTLGGQKFFVPKSEADMVIFQKDMMQNITDFHIG